MAKISDFAKAAERAIKDSLDLERTAGEAVKIPFSVPHDDGKKEIEAAVQNKRILIQELAPALTTQIEASLTGATTPPQGTIAQALTYAQSAVEIAKSCAPVVTYEDMYQRLQCIEAAGYLLQEASRLSNIPLQGNKASAFLSITEEYVDRSKLTDIVPVKGRGDMQPIQLILEQYKGTIDQQAQLQKDVFSLPIVTTGSQQKPAKEAETESDQSMGEKITDAAKDAINKVKSAAGTATESAKSVGAQVTDAAKDTAEKAKSAAETVTASAKSAGAQVTDAVKNAASSSPSNTASDTNPPADTKTNTEKSEHPLRDYIKHDFQEVAEAGATLVTKVVPEPHQRLEAISGQTVVLFQSHIDTLKSLCDPGFVGGYVNDNKFNKACVQIGATPASADQLLKFVLAVNKGEMPAVSTDTFPEFFHPYCPTGHYATYDPQHHGIYGTEGEGLQIFCLPETSL